MFNIEIEKKRSTKRKREIFVQLILRERDRLTQRQREMYVQHGDRVKDIYLQKERKKQPQGKPGVYKTTFIIILIH